MKLKRAAPGHYRSVDGRVEIKRVISQQTYRATEILWEAIIDGHSLPMGYDTKKEAVKHAEKRLVVLQFNTPLTDEQQVAAQKAAAPKLVCPGVVCRCGDDTVEFCPMHGKKA